MPLSLGRAERGGAGLLDGAVYRHVSGDVDRRRKGLEAHVGQRLEDLLVGPAGLARLLVEVERGPALLLDDGLQVAQQRRLTLVARVELAGELDLVEAQSARARHPAVHGEPGLGAG